jgi:hypothetical protein
MAERSCDSTESWQRLIWQRLKDSLLDSTSSSFAHEFRAECSIERKIPSPGPNYIPVSVTFAKSLIPINRTTIIHFLIDCISTCFMVLRAHPLFDSVLSSSSLRALRPPSSTSFSQYSVIAQWPTSRKRFYASLTAPHRNRCQPSI